MIKVLLSNRHHRLFTQHQLLINPFSSLLETSLSSAPSSSSSSSSSTRIFQPTFDHHLKTFSTSSNLFIWGQRKKDQVDKNFKTYKPITPAIRHLRLPRNDHLYKGRCYLPLTIPKRKTGGRNNSGKITTRHLGGGHKQRLRNVDFHRHLPGPQEVVRIEYDPGRSAHIALIKHCQSGHFSYILAPLNLRVGQIVQSFKSGIPKALLNSSNSILDDDDASSLTTSAHQDLPSSFSESYQNQSANKNKKIDQNQELISAKEVSNSTLTLGLLRTLTIKPGNFLPIRLIPPGTTIHAISLKPDGKASLVRSAGTFAKVVSLGHHHPARKSKASHQPHQQVVEQSTTSEETESRETFQQDSQGDYAQIKLQSGEIRLIHMDACATIGAVSNPHWQGRKLGKAGRVRWLGRRPRVRGVAMNKVDHPLGGGRGKSKSNKQPVSPTGLKAKGLRTRRPGPRGNRMVIKQRPKGKHVGK